VLVDDVSVGAVAFYEFSDVNANHTINAIFASNTNTITATAGANGSIAPNGGTTVNCGSNQSFTITPDPCYQIADVLVDNISVGPVFGYTFSDVRQDHTISASFAIKTYNITATAGSNGTINPAGITVVNCNASQQYTITAAPNFHILDVLVDGVSNPGAISSGTYTFSFVQVTHTISATFAANNNPCIPTITASGPLSLCPGNDVVLTSSVALSYQWYRNNVAIKKATKQSVTATESGSYHVVARVSTACGLVSSDQVTVTISSGTPDLVTIADAYTNNNNPQGVRPNKIYKSFLPAYSSLMLVANASGSGLVYSWKNAGNQLVGSTASLQVTVAGSYTVYVSNSSGCQGVASKTIALIDVKCGGSKVQVCNSNVTQCVTSAQAQTLLTQGAFLGACTEQSLISRSQPASTDLLVNDLQVRSYPNPASSYFTLLIKSIRTEKVQVRIVDLLGRQLETHTTAPNSTIKIGQRFMPGVYMAEIRQGKTRKIVPLYKLGN
ncbi:MAG: T9SS type A sorting domain-containing protein, partial [Bacteroidota bacterium]